MKIGILGTADIAFRRFLPALGKYPAITYAGVASREMEKTARFIEAYGGQGYPSYEALLEEESIDAVYVPLRSAGRKQNPCWHWRKKEGWQYMKIICSCIIASWQK